MANRNNPSRGARLAVRLAFAVAMLGGAALLVSGLGYRFGLLGLSAAFALLAAAAWVGAAGVVLCLVAAAIAWRSRQRRALAALFVGAIAGAFAFGVPWSMQEAAGQAPPIHDITTDTQNPPRFVALAAARNAAPNGAAYADGAAVALQHKAYPDILPLAVGAHPPAAYQRSLAAARALGWHIALADPKALRIEATATTRFFGFKDDIVIRITPLGSASRVDIRSASRVGRNDLGMNAKRIRAFYREMARKG